MKTLGEVLEQNKNIGPGFDFLRVFLALSIVCFHSLTVTNQYFTPYSLDDTPFWIVHYSLVPMFFALSGFLISGSAGRLSLKNFLINRGLRIVPALAVDTFVCALIIGPIFTTVSLNHYFFTKEFASFFLNIIGWVHFTLPGVFMTHAVARVNGSLWTVPFELVCYLMISIMIVIGVIKHRFLVLAFVLAYLFTALAIQLTGALGFVHSPPIQKFVSVVFIEHEAQAVTGFLFGIVAYQNRLRIPYSPYLFAACVAAILAIAFTLPMAQGQSPLLRFILLPALAYVTVFIGLTPMPLPKFFKTGDYSYGIYLYHQPFLQIVISLFPAFALAPHTGAAFTFLVGLPFIIGIAWLSWHFVEKPLLALRKRFTIIAKIRGIDQPSHAAAAPSGSERLDPLPAASQNIPFAE
jgi:peptidoglycan/LPS O-acetylase OafA/YrhL